MTLSMAATWGWVLLGAAWVLGGGGALVAARALLADRARGRRRCQRCWYDMAGAPPPGLKCPECGREARSERALFRTRRRWRRAMAGVALVLAGAALAAGERVGEKGWV